MVLCLSSQSSDKTDDYRSSWSSAWDFIWPILHCIMWNAKYLQKIMILSSALELCTGQTLNFKMLPLHMIYHNVLSTLLCLAKVWHKMSNVVGRTTLSTTVMADIQPMSLPMQFHHTEHPPLCIAWFMRGSSCAVLSVIADTYQFILCFDTVSCITATVSSI